MSAKRPASPVQGPSAKKTRTAPAAAQENPSNPPIPPSDIPERVNLKYQFGGDKCKLNLILPPMYNIEDIFKSITEHAMRCGFKKFLDHMDSKPLRIATACSGTESPLLALQMVERHLREVFNVTFVFEHLFSAEIVPYKQMYIERNFLPERLFRDVSQLKHHEAQTAYGALVKVPKEVDILIAGFSCVDFSALNNKKKTLDDRGESGDTLIGLIEYAESCRPRMVILENVKNCPWDKVAERWEAMGYLAVHIGVDTKDFYLPQTRCRGYMLCIDKQHLANRPDLEANIPDQWRSTLDSFKRRASSPAGWFLLDHDDPKLEQIESDMAVRILTTSSRPAAWDAYAARHVRYRTENQLGHRRPVSRSEAHYRCQMPDFTWHTWARAMPERVWDTIDINFLRRLQAGHDMHFKERFIDLSQGIERETDSRPYGIIGCLTPCGIPFVTSRAGPVSGRESLALQGLPRNRMVLTKETERELQDLAGNAMSSTVVGSAILSALIVGYQVFDREHSPTTGRNQDSDMQPLPLERYDLARSDIRIGKVFDVNLAELQAQAAECVRYCMCERHSRFKQTIWICKECHHTACSDCAGNPSHSFIEAANLSRSSPLEFINKLKSILPTRLVFSGISEQDYDIFKLDPKLECDLDTWQAFLNSVMQVVGDELRFSHINRSEFWTVAYNGKSSILQLVIGATAISWLLFAKPSESEPVASLNRVILDKPIAKMAPVPECILVGDWEICAPLSSKGRMTIHGTGTRIPSYEQTCGLQTPKHKDSQVWSELVVDGSDQDVNELDVDIRGTYKSLPKCGMAKATLHKKEASADSPAVYMFLDPVKYGAPEGDMFAFSLEHRRITGYESRLTIAQVSHKWRSWCAGNQPDPVDIYHRRWRKVETASLEPFGVDSSIECGTLNPATSITIGDIECNKANVPIALFSAPASVIELPWQRGPWRAIDSGLESSLEANFSWMVQRAAGFAGFEQWNRVNGHGQSCGVCAPQKPGILWASVQGRVKAFEHPVEAREYERQAKKKPSTFCLFHRIDEGGTGRLLITVNVQALVHRAWDTLIGPRVDSSASFSWRLVPNAHSVTPMWENPRFVSNHGDPQATPSHFRIELRPEQKRSLFWMISQEQEDIPDFEEEEIEEAFLPLTAWRAECRVTVQKTIRGGVLADEVGYGKTAVTLALISTRSEHDKQAWQTDGLIPCAATLIIVPEHLINQWRGEINKFTNIAPSEVLVLNPGTLAKKTVGDIQKARIILVSLSMFGLDTYYRGMRKFTGASNVPQKAGRYFDHWFKNAQNALEEHVRILIDDGQEPMLAEINKKHERARENSREFTYEPSKRHRGKAYMKAKGRKSGASIPGTEDRADAESLEADVLAGTEIDDPDEIKARLAKLHPAIASERSQKPDEIDSKADSRDWDLRQEFNIRESHGFKNVRIPVLHAFSFNRLVIDEFTYVDKGRLDPFFALKARSKWILSGTPPGNDFTDINMIARLIGVNLGIENDELNTRRKRATNELELENFLSFQETRSGAWHQNRNDVVKRFLDRFARQNVADIDEIPCSEHIILTRPSPAEVAIYLELHMQLMAQDGWVKLCNNASSMKEPKEKPRRRPKKRQSSSDESSGEESDKDDPTSENVGNEETSKESLGDDRRCRQAEIVQMSTKPTEALVKRAACLVLENGWRGKRPRTITLKSLIALRREEVAQTESHFTAELEKVMSSYFDKAQGGEKLRAFITNVAGKNFGDQTICSRVFTYIKELLSGHGHTLEGLLSDVKDAGGIGDIIDRAPVNALPKERSGLGANEESETESDDEAMDQDTELRGPTEPSNSMSGVGEITKLMEKLVLRTGELRLLESVGRVQRGEIPKCDSCKQQPNTPGNINILDPCGHVLCEGCIMEAADKEKCAVVGCGGMAKPSNMVKGHQICSRKVGYGECGNDQCTDVEMADAAPSNEAHMAEDMSAADGNSPSAQYGGSKMDKLVEIIQAIPEDEKVLLFIQFEDIASLVKKTLKLAGITHSMVTPPKKIISRKAGEYEKELKEQKVLVLILGSEQSAGLNLQHANHVIFLSPLLCDTQYDYEASMCQAIGRARRYGQEKHVHVYHLLANKTIDVNLFQDRRGRILIERDGQAILASREEASAEELISCQGPIFNEHISIGWW